MLSPTTKKPKSQPQQDPWYTIFTNNDPEYNAYMRDEWGHELHGEDHLFERLTLEGAQSGLSWRTILKKRQAYRRTFHNFDVAKVARMTKADVERIVNAENEDPTQLVVRHRGKIESVIQNAKCIQEMEDESLDDFFWNYVDHRPVLNMEPVLSKIPRTNETSQAISKELKSRGFRFVGPTTMYALMEAIGMLVNHPKGSPEWKMAKERLEQREGGYQEGPLTK